MKFLVDNALPSNLASMLRSVGFDAVHVRERDLQVEADIVILALAEQEGRVILSADADFGDLLAKSGSTQPSFILFRDPEFLRAADYLKILLPALDSLRTDLQAGCVAVFRSGRLRVRGLPLTRF